MGYQALLFCTDEKLARVVSQVFSELDFAVDPVTEPFAAVKKLMAQHYDAIVVDCDNEQNSALLFKSARNSSSNQGSLAIALVEGQAGVAKAYRIGANLVLTKPINVEQAKGTLRVARGLLRKNSEATPATHAAAATAGTAPAASVAPAIQPTNRIVEAFAVPATRGQSPEFDAPLSVTASTVEIAEMAVPAPASAPTPAKDWSSLSAPPKIAPVSLAAARAAREQLTITEAPKPTAVPGLNPGSRSQGAASAPAPAKEAIAPTKQSEKDTRAEFAKTEATARLQSSFSSSAGSVPEGPSFILSDDAGGSGGSKKILIAAVAVLVLAGAGYFGWTKFGQERSATTSQIATTTAQRAAEPVRDSSPTAASVPAPAVSTTGRQGMATTSAPRTSAATSSAKPDQPPTAASSTTRIAIRPETEARESASAPLQVKSSTKAVGAPAEESAVQLPSPLAVASPGDTGLSGVLSAASSDVPKPTLARIKISQGVSQGLVIKRVQPKYPLSAKATHLEGAVQLEATVNKEGTVVSPKVLSGNPMLAGAALEAVRQWRYKPYYLDGEPVEIQTQITVTFKAH